MERPLRFIVSFAWMTYISLVAAPPFGREAMSNTAQNDHFSRLLLLSAKVSLQNAPGSYYCFV